jgi:hypothetical protein
MNEVEKLDIPALIMWGAEDAFQPMRRSARGRNAESSLRKGRPRWALFA